MTCCFPVPDTAPGRLARPIGKKEAQAQTEIEHFPNEYRGSAVQLHET